MAQPIKISVDQIPETLKVKRVAELSTYSVTAGGDQIMILRVYRIGFKGKRQLPFLLIWREWFDAHSGEVEFAQVLFNSMDWIGA